MRKAISFLLFLMVTCCLQAQNWDYVCISEEYYYGEGKGKTKDEACKEARAALIKMVAEDMTRGFKGLKGQKGDHQTAVYNCMNTYAFVTTEQNRNAVVTQLSMSDAPKAKVRQWMKRSDLGVLFEERIQSARNMLNLAGQYEQEMQIDMALRYYYWAYCMLNTVQYPKEVKDEQGRVLVEWLPEKMDDILKNIEVTVNKKEDDLVVLNFQYDGKPIVALDYNYFDGEEYCLGSAKDGLGTMEFVTDQPLDKVKINVEYQYLDYVRGDVEMSGVLRAVPSRSFAKANLTIGKHEGRSEADASRATASTTPAVQTPQQSTTPAQNNVLGFDVKKYNETIGRVIGIISARRYTDATPYFTKEGLEMYSELIQYGTGRIVGRPEIYFTRGVNGTVVARGLQMSFSFRNGKKKTFVEDVVFSFDDSGKIFNVAFGLGEGTTKDILSRYAPGWTDDVRLTIIEFLENYKTAYSLKRLDYIESIFADNATIIVGNVVRNYENRRPQEDGKVISVSGQQKINYNKYDKKSYLKKLRTCFRRQEFINIHFTNTDVQRLEKPGFEDWYAINIGQEYNSSSYSDKGYLFLMVNMTDREAPLIQVRTWQPNEEDITKLYNAGDFYND